MNPLSFLHERFIKSRRAERLADLCVEMLPEDARVLSVGCGQGQVDHLISQKNPRLKIEGIDVLIRDETFIPVTEFDGTTYPFEDNSVDAVLIIDVLHHAEDPLQLLREAARVSSNVVIVKDHVLSGLLSKIILSFMDETGNRRFGVALPYSYLKEPEWKALLSLAGLRIKEWKSKLNLYGPFLGLVFDRSLHVMMRLEPGKD